MKRKTYFYFYFCNKCYQQFFPVPDLRDFLPSACFFPLPLRGRGKNIFPIPGPLRFPWNLRGRPFLRFRYFFLFLVLFPESPQIPLESEGTAVLPIPKESERRAKEKSKIFLFTVCRRKSLAIFDGRRGSFFSDFFGVRKKGRISPDSFGVGGNIRKRTGFLFPELLRSRGKYRKRKKFALFPRFPPIPLEWEGTRLPSDSLRFFYRAIHGSIKKRGGPIGDRGPRGDVFPEPFMARKKTRESEETLLCRRKSQAIFDGRGRVPRKFIEFSGDRVSSDSEGIGGDPAPAVENRKRFSTAGEGPFSFRKRTGFPLLRRSRGKYRNGRKRSSAVENRKRFSTAEVGSPENS